MLQGKRKIFFLTGILFYSVSLAQHPDFKRVDSLVRILPEKQGTQRVDCLNDIAEEYWWPTKKSYDIILKWAIPAYKESEALNYAAGRAKALMLFGVAEIFKKILALPKSICDSL